MLVERMAPFTSTIFAEMSALAVATGSINLGQGFPDTDGPAEVARGRRRGDPRRASTSTRPAPASRSCARPSPSTSSASTASTFDPDTEVLVTTGRHRGHRRRAARAAASPATRSSTFEPYYDSYAACIAMAGGGACRSRCGRRTSPSTWTSCAPRSPPAPGWCCSTPRTTRPARSSPARELTRSPTLAVEHDLLVVTDEVYEHLVFDGADTSRWRRCPGMRERTVTISSAGKTFSFTGWKVGWVHGAGAAGRGGPGRQAVPHLRQRRARSSTRSPRRSALPDAYFDDLARRPARASATCSSTACAAAGFAVYPPQGTYFVTTDIAPLGDDDGARVLPRAARALRRGRRAERRSSTTTPTSAGPWCGSPSASATRCWPRRCRGWRSSAGSRDSRRSSRESRRAGVRTTRRVRKSIA